MTYMMVLGTAYCCGDELLGAADGIGQLTALGKIGGNGRREGAACAVEIAAGDFFCRIHTYFAIGRTKQIITFITMTMTALKQIGVASKGIA